MEALRILTLGLAALAAYGAPSFLFPQNITVEGTILWIVAGDFNNDGIDDFAVSYQTGPSTAAIAIFLGSHSGQLVRKNVPQITPDGTDVVWAAADLNRDGNLDVITLEGIALGNGDGTFQPLIPFPPATIASLRPLGLGLPSLSAPAGSLIQIADFNNDGIPDLCIANFPLYLDVRLGHGDGTFGLPIPTPPLFATYPVLEDELAVFTVGDFDGDGDVDVAYSGTLGGVTILFGGGDGVFNRVGYASQTRYFPGSLIAAVLTSSGRADLIEQAGELEVMLQDGSGNFPAYAQTYPVPSLISTGWAGPLAAANFSTDTKKDIASYFFIYPANGDGTLGSPVGFGQTPGLTSSPSTTSTGFLAGLPYAPPPLVVADVNGDGKPDLIGVGPTLDTITVLINSTGTPVASAPIYQAATGLQLLAPGAIATIYGAGLSAATATATAPNQTTLGNTSVEIFDFAGRTILAPLLYVSPTQINFQVPDSTAVNGPAIINVLGNGLLRGANSALVVPVAPGIFTLDGSGKGAPFASALRVAPDGTQTPLPTNQPIPIDSTSQVFLSLYATGIPEQTGTTSGSCTLSAANPSVTPVVAQMIYFGPQSATSAIEQINIPLPGNTPKGTVNIACTFYTLISGIQSDTYVPINPGANTVTITVQ